MWDTVKVWGITMAASVATITLAHVQIVLAIAAPLVSIAYTIYKWSKE